MDLKFIVIEDVIPDPTSKHGECCCGDTCITLTDNGYMVIGFDVDGKVLCSQVHEFDVECEGKRWHINHIVEDVFTRGEIIVINAKTGREVGGRERKPSKWNVKYKEFDDIKEAAQYALKVTNEYNFQ